MKFGNSVADNNQAHAIWLGGVQIWHFYLTLSSVIVFFVVTVYMWEAMLSWLLFYKLMRFDWNTITGCAVAQALC